MMTERMPLKFVTIAFLTSTLIATPALACGGGSPSFAAKMKQAAEQAPAQITNILETVLDLGATLTQGFAETKSLSSPVSPSAPGAISGLIGPLGEVAAEQAITDYKVAGYQRQMVEIYGPMVAGGMMSVDAATNAVMAANYAPGAGRAAVEQALQEYADGRR